MAYIPEGALWYLAWIVEELVVEDDPRNVVHTNLVLIRADSPEEAYQKALAFGKQGEDRYPNPEGKLVTIRFRGLHDLNVVHDPLEDGAELAYTEECGRTEADLQAWITAKEELGVFSPTLEKEVPNYASGEIVAEVKKGSASEKDRCLEERKVASIDYRLDSTAQSIVVGRRRKDSAKVSMNTPKSKA